MEDYTEELLLENIPEEYDDDPDYDDGFEM